MMAMEMENIKDLKDEQRRMTLHEDLKEMIDLQRLHSHEMESNGNEMENTKTRRKGIIMGPMMERRRSSC